MVLHNNYFDADGNLKPRDLKGMHGLVTPVQLRDIGREGLADMVDKHTYKFADNTNAFYGVIMQEVSDTYYITWNCYYCRHCY